MNCYLSQFAKTLQPYKEETMEETKEDLCVYDKLDFEQEPCADKVELVLGDNYEIKVEDGKTYVVKKKPQYQKTYAECCETLNVINTEIPHIILSQLGKPITSFAKLLICRDAYWKIAEEGNKGNIDYVICNVGGKIINTNIPNSAYNHILAFPTEEMRDAFYENFKDLIEECKELL